jgi:alkylation response protein AidB-like acyl-CoA dehydrogenase
VEGSFNHVTTLTRNTIQSGGDLPSFDLFLVDPQAEGVKLSQQMTLAADTQYRVDFEGVKVSAGDRIGGSGTGWATWSATLHDGVILLAAIVVGGSARSMAVATLIFTQVNTIKHTFVNLPYFPFKTLDYVTSIHAAHHVDMNCGNYATLTMVYDWLFGTLEKPVSRPTA